MAEFGPCAHLSSVSLACSVVLCSRSHWYLSFNLSFHPLPFCLGTHAHSWDHFQGDCLFVYVLSLSTFLYDSTFVSILRSSCRPASTPLVSRRVEMMSAALWHLALPPHIDRLRRPCQCCRLQSTRRVPPLLLSLLPPPPPSSSPPRAPRDMAGGAGGRKSAVSASTTAGRRRERREPETAGTEETETELG